MMAIVALRRDSSWGLLHGNHRNKLSPQTCSKCYGTGTVRCDCRGSGKLLCPLCDGTSIISVVGALAGQIVTAYTHCSRCDEGYIPCQGHDAWGKVECSACSRKA